MITFFGYDEIRRLNEERQRRSIQRQRIIRALGETASSPAPQPGCEVIEWDFGARADDQEKMGA